MAIDYKKIIRSRRMREGILSVLSWVPDCAMIKLQYRVKTGRKLNLADPRRFTEKLQWMKLFYRDSLMNRCADKVSVRGYVEECGLGSLLVPVVGVFERDSRIDFSSFPERFVLKDSLGGGGNDVLVCTDREAFDIKYACEEISRWTAPGRHAKHPGREWVYDCPGSSRVLVEEFIESKDRESMVEFKFFCFDGSPEYLYVLGNRVLGKGVKLGIFSVADFERVDAWRTDEERLEGPVTKPSCYEAMVDAARVLSRPFPHARVDFYLVSNDEFRFSEITFFDGSGYFLYEPDEFDFEIGRFFTLPKGGTDEPCGCVHESECGVSR